MKRTQKHPGGRPKGALSKKTLDQKIVMEAFRQRVMKSANKLINAQLTLAKGVTYLYKIEQQTNKKGDVIKSKPILVTDQHEIEEYLAGAYDENGEDYYFITTDKPDNKALDSLFDRVLGKASTPIDLTTKGESLNKMNYERAKSIIRGREGSNSGDSTE